MIEGAVIVMGLGNRYRSDDAAGLEVARRVLAAAAGADVVELEGEPIDLLDAWDGVEAAVVVDAVGPAGNPGAIRVFDASDARIPVSFRGRGTHAFSVGDAIELARATGRMPSSLLVYGIEGAVFEAGTGLSPDVERAVEEVAGLILDVLPRGRVR